MTLLPITPNGGVSLPVNSSDSHFIKTMYSPPQLARSTSSNKTRMERLSVMGYPPTKTPFMYRTDDVQNPKSTDESCGNDTILLFQFKFLVFFSTILFLLFSSPVIMAEPTDGSKSRFSLDFCNTIYFLHVHATSICECCRLRICRVFAICSHSDHPASNGESWIWKVEKKRMWLR